MRVEWHDERTHGDTWESLFKIDAWYSGSDNPANYPVFTDPSDYGSDYFHATVYNVMENTYMTIYYTAFVYDDRGATVCSDGGWTYFYFY